VTAYRVDVGVDGPVQRWLLQIRPREFLIRCPAYQTVRGWYMKVVCSSREGAEWFCRRRNPDAEDRAVGPVRISVSPELGTSLASRLGHAALIEDGEVV